MTSFLIILTAFIWIDYTSAGYADPFKITRDVQGFGNKFQAVVVNDVTNLTEIVNSLEHPENKEQLLKTLAHLVGQFYYSYTEFSNALQYLISLSEKALHNRDIYPNDFYIPDKDLLENIALCQKTKQSVDQILALINNLHQNAKQIKLEIDEISVKSGIAAFPSVLASQLGEAVGRLGMLNGMISQFLAQLAQEINNFVIADVMPLRENQVLVPIHEYGHIMKILSKICRQLQHYFQKLVPASVFVGKTKSRVLIDMRKELPITAQVIDNVKDLYAITEATMAEVLQFLRIYGEPISMQPLETPPSNSDGIMFPPFPQIPEFPNAAVAKQQKRQRAKPQYVPSYTLTSMSSSSN